MVSARLVTLVVFAAGLSVVAAPSGDAAAAEKGWAAVLATGPMAPGFLEGVYNSSNAFAALGNELRADAVYVEAEASCAGSVLHPVKLRIQYMHADRLIRNSEYVKAEAVLRDALDADSGLYVAVLQSLALVREQQGDVEGAEVFYRKALGHRAPDLSGVVRPEFETGNQRLPFVGEPRSSLATFYSNQKRYKEAESLLREQLAQTSPTNVERIGVMNQLVSLLRVQGSKVEAVALEEQIVRLRHVQGGDLVANERYNLANLFVETGRGDEAKTMLESDLRQAEAQHGKSSLEYRQALNYLFENRRYARDYESAEKLAREQVVRAEASADERILLQSALSQLSDVLRVEGKTEEADAAHSRSIELIRAQSPHPASTARFAEAEELVKAGKPGQAARVAQEIFESLEPDPANYYDRQFGYRHLAQQLAGMHNAEAAQVASLGVMTVGLGRPSEDAVAAHGLADWANFYRGSLGQPERANELLTRAEAIVRACCGASSRMMEPVLQERAWLAAATDGPAAGIPYLEQLKALRASIYGAGSRPVEEANRDLAEANAKAGR